MRKRQFWLAITTLLGASFSIYHSRNGLPASTTDFHQIAATPNTTTKKSSPDTEQPNLQRVAIDKLKSEFIHLDSLRGQLNKHQLREEKLRELAKDSQNVEIASRSLLDFDWTIENFGDKQAEVRVYSIELLKSRAHAGDFEPLKSSGRLLAQQLTNDPNAWRKGREHDLRDLIGAYIQLKGRESILSAPGQIFETFAYQPELKKVFTYALLSYLYKPGFDEEANNAVMPFWDKNFG